MIWAGTGNSAEDDLRQAVELVAQRDWTVSVLGGFKDSTR